MAEKAQITSVEVIESFRARLIVFLSQARPVLDEVSHEMSRLRLWLENEQRMYWQNELRLRNRRLEAARQELSHIMLSQFHGTTALHQMAVQRAQRAVHEAETKLKVLKKWARELENFAAPLLKQTDQLNGFLATDMARAAAYLDQMIKTLDAYRSVSISRPDGLSADPAKTEEIK